MDATSSSLPFDTRDGSTSAAAAAVEDDTALSLAAGLAKEAALLFQAGKLPECRRVLNQLSQKKDDPKVRHNMVIAENFQDGCSDPKRLLESLENIKNQIEELAQTSGECLEVTCDDGGKSTSSMKGTNNSVNHLSRSSLVYSEKFDTSVAMFNIAVIWFHLHEYSKSFLYLDTLYQVIEPIDEGTALRICLLLLDVALLSHHASKSADVITYMEKVFRVNSLANQVDNGTLAQQSLLVPKSAPLPSNSTVPDSSQSDAIITGNALENFLTRTLSEEALEDESLQLLSSLDISGQNLQRPGILSSSDPPRNQVEDDLRRKMHLYKVRFFLLTRNLKAAKREVKMAMNLARGKDYPMALYLKSQLEYARRNYRKAIKLLMAPSNLTETGISSMYYNNLGCIYYQLGKHHTSGVFFSQALKKCSAVRKERSSNLLTLSQDKSLLISYNCGIHSLACGRPFHAARCFQKASLIFSNRPLLWLRIAECCLMALEKGLILANSPAAGRHDIGVNIIGKGKWRELALRHESSANGQSKHVEIHPPSGDDAKKPELSMPLARQCLVNALHLLESSEPKNSRYGFPLATDESDPSETLSQSTDSKTVAVGDHEEPNAASGSIQPNSNGEVKEHKGGNTQNASLQNSITEYEDIRMKENLMMKQAILADLAYVELLLGDPLKALSTAKSLLKLPECSRIYIFLGTMYIAEALCLLNQPAEAATHLMKYISHGNDALVPYSQEDCEKWTVEKAIDNEDSNAGTIAPGIGSSSDKSQTIVYSSPEEACGILCANYAANLALLGDIEQAHQFVTKALSSIPRSSQAILTAIYLDLKRGKTEDALAKLKQHSAIRFLRDSVTSLSG